MPGRMRDCAFVWKAPRTTLNSFIEWSIEAGNLLSGNGALRTIVTPSAPRGEFDGVPGRRERPNQCRHRTIESSLSTYPTLGSGRRRRIAPSDPSVNQPSRQFQAACPERPNPSRTFINLNIGLNLEPNEWQKRRINVQSSVGNLNQNCAEKNELNCTESEFSKRETRNWLLVWHSDRSNKTI